MNNLELARPASFGRTLDKRGETGSDHSTTPFVTQLIAMLRRRKWIVAGTIAGALILGLGITLLMTPQYDAESTLEIRRETGNVAEGQNTQSQFAAVDQEFYNTQYGLLKSRTLAERVATDLRLFDNPAFFEMMGARGTEAWFDGGRVVQGASTRSQRIRKAGALLLDNFDVSAQRMSRLVTLTFTSPDPDLSRRVVDAWAAGFIRLTLERRYEASSYARRFLESRLDQLRSRIDQSERLLVAYASREGIVNLPGATVSSPQGTVTTPERSLLADSLAQLNNELDRARADRIQAESRLGSAAGEVPEALTNQAISGLRQQRAQAAAEYARMMVQFEPDYPPARALQTQIEQLDRAIAQEERRVGNSLEQTYRAAVEREQRLASQVDALRSQMLDQRRRSIQYNILQRDADTNRQLYDALLQRYKEIGIAGGVGINNISIVDPAQLPTRPSSPKLLFNLLLALIAGSVLGIGGAAAMEQIDRGINDPSDIEGALGTPLLGTIPKITGDPLEPLADRKSTISEAAISLMTSLSFSTDHGVPRSFAVSSTRPMEGKSTIAYALARSLARSRRRVLLIDGDLRAPSVHHIVGIGNEGGLSNYLAGNSEIDALLRPTDHDGLVVMTAGPQPPSASELLSSDRLGALLAQLAERFDHVVIDAPPVMGLADALLIGNRVEGLVFVVQAHRTSRDMARSAIERLVSANVTLLGSILTRWDSRRAHYGQEYEYGYGYGYGEAAEPAGGA